VDVGKLTTRLEVGIERLDGILVDSLALLMPAGSYQVALIRLYPSAVRLGSSEDYFFAEQVENEGGVDPFWGVPHCPKVPITGRTKGTLLLTAAGWAARLAVYFSS
jgi:hypothetical protein